MPGNPSAECPSSFDHCYFQNVTKFPCCTDKAGKKILLKRKNMFKVRHAALVSGEMRFAEEDEEEDEAKEELSESETDTADEKKTDKQVDDEDEDIDAM